jgi:hypothetical protein
MQSKKVISQSTRRHITVEMDLQEQLCEKLHSERTAGTTEQHPNVTNKTLFPSRQD